MRERVREFRQYAFNVFFFGVVILDGIQNIDIYMRDEREKQIDEREKNRQRRERELDR